MSDVEMKPDAVVVEGDAPVRKIDSDTLRSLGGELARLFTTYASDRRLVELRWLRNLRQYLGIYDEEVERQLPPNGSRAYPRVTRAKCLSVLSRLMNLMFQGNERNWELGASPSADMAPDDVAEAVKELLEKRAKDGLDQTLTKELIDAAVQHLADSRAQDLTRLIDDQLQELGGDQTLDFINLNRKVCDSGIKYGLGVLRGPFVRKVQQVGWMGDGAGGFKAQTRDVYRPQYDFTSVWDVYPDMSARKLPGEGYFVRMVLGKSEVRKLANREDFMGDQIKHYLSNNSQGNYKAREFESDLRSMGTKVNVNEAKTDPQGKYEIIIWNGPVSARQLQDVGADIADDKLADDVEAEVWMIDGNVIKADMNPWRKMGVENMQTIHFFQFDEDDTSPVGNGLPYVVRDSAMSIAAATRMTLDNAAITCGPNLELNLSLLRSDQDLKTIEPYKIWYRDDDDPATAMAPAVREININGHLNELKSLIETFMGFADMESFVGPATGGDMEKAPSEPMRTAAGQSMLRGDAALPFKDIVRNYDSFTQSVILSLVQFNRKFNPVLAPPGDYNVIARGATSLVAKEVRGMQVDILATSLTEDERDHVDARKFVEARFASRDLTSLLATPEEAARRKEGRQQAMAAAQATQDETTKAGVRKTLAEAYKNITQGQKNSAAADAQTTNLALEILENAIDGTNQQGAGATPGK